MRRWCFAMVALVACSHDDPIEQLERPKVAAPGVAWAPPRPPPPPPPPSGPRFVEPPVEISAFLAQAAHAIGPWHVTINELADEEPTGRALKGRRFLGRRVTHARAVAQPLADDLVARLAMTTSYVDGDSGCVGDPVGIEVARGSLTIDFIEDCHHLFLTEHGHQGAWALFSSEMGEFVTGVRGTGEPLR